MVINQDHYIDAGLDPQGADQLTWEGLAATVERLSRKDSSGNYSRIGFTYHIPGMPEFAAWLYANGGEMHNAELTEAIFDTAEALEVAEHRQIQHVRYKDRVEGFPGGSLDILKGGQGSGISWAPGPPTTCATSSPKTSTSGWCRCRRGQAPMARPVALPGST